MRYLIALIIFVGIAAMLYVRLAPIDIASVHVRPQAAEPLEITSPGGFKTARQITTSAPDLIKALDEVILSTPRTRRIAGAPGTEMLTYETKSAVFGFPDYTTLTILRPEENRTGGPLLVVDANARFGYSDMGKNEERVRDWLDQLGPLTLRP